MAVAEGCVAAEGAGDTPSRKYAAASARHSIATGMAIVGESRPVPPAEGLVAFFFFDPIFMCFVGSAELVLRHFVDDNRTTRRPPGSLPHLTRGFRDASPVREPGQLLIQLHVFALSVWSWTQRPLHVAREVTMSIHIVERSLSAIDAKILELEQQLAEEGSDSDVDEPETSGSREASNRDAVATVHEQVSQNELFWASRHAGESKSARKKAASRKKRKLLGVHDDDEEGSKKKKKSAKRKQKEAVAAAVTDAAASTIAAPSAAPVTLSAQATPLACECCGIEVNSEALMREHLQGRKHALAVKVRDARAEGRYCEACEVAFTGPNQYTDHCKGRRHKEMLGRKEGSGGLPAAPQPARGKGWGGRGAAHPMRGRG